MDRCVARGSSRLAPVMMIVGAAAVLLGCALPWFSMRADFSRFGGSGIRTTTANGLDTSDGPMFLVVAIAIGVLGVVALVSTASTVRVGVSLVAALGSLFVAGFAIYDALTPTSQAIEEASNDLGGALGAPAVRRFIEGLFDRGVISIGVEFGLWIVIGGGAVALIGSLLTAVTAGSMQRPIAATPFAPMEQAWPPPVPPSSSRGAPMPPGAPPDGASSPEATPPPPAIPGRSPTSDAPPSTTPSARPDGPIGENGAPASGG